MKYGLRPLDVDVRHQIENMEFKCLEIARKKLVLIESHNVKLCFNKIFKLFPEKIRPEKRTGYKAYDGVNNVFRARANERDAILNMNLMKKWRLALQL